MKFPFVSIIIPTYNRKEKVIRLFESVLNLDYPRDRLEYIIVDDASPDKTYNELKKRFNNVPNLILHLNKANKQISETRNIGFSKSKGEFIFFIDDDTIVHKNSLKELIKFFMKNGNKFLLGPLILEYNQEDIIWNAGISMNYSTTHGTSLNAGKSINNVKLPLSIKSDTLMTAYMGHRDLFEKVGRTNAELFKIQFEEQDFCVRSELAGYKIYIIRDSIIWHDHTAGIFLNNPERMYYAVRNRFIAYKLWSHNPLESFFSQIFSFIMPMIYIYYKFFVYKENKSKCLKAMAKGISDGFFLALKLKPYIKDKEFEKRYLK